MDGTRFDQLARSFARSRSRRHVLGALLGAVTGGVGLGAVDAATCRAVGSTCRDGANCCSGRCVKDRAGRGHCECRVPADCPASRKACYTAVCNNGTCGIAPAVGQSCDDGNACTVNDACQANGTCAGVVKDCSALSDGCNDGVCDPSTGACVKRPKANNTPCDDGDKCTTGDTCQAGVCTPGPTTICVALDQCHEVGTCDPSTGVCSNPNKPDGTTCNDDNACTSGDTCQNGVCTGGTPVECATDNLCLTASCDPEQGCITTPKGAGTACGDSNLCNGNETCNGAGQCIPGTPVTCGPCLRCNQSNGTCEVDTAKIGTSCPGDGNKCFAAFTCSAAGVCEGQQPVTCAALDQCHSVGTCDPATGLCSNPDKQDGTTCDDGDNCTSNTTCQSGVCTGSRFSNCQSCETFDTCPMDEENTCHVRRCINGRCTFEYLPDGAFCAVDDPCVTEAKCFAGGPRGFSRCQATKFDPRAACSDPCETVDDCTDRSRTCTKMACIEDNQLGTGGCEVVADPDNNGAPCQREYVTGFQPTDRRYCIFDGACDNGTCTGEAETCSPAPTIGCCFDNPDQICGRGVGGECAEDAQCCSERCVNGTCVS